MSDPAIRTVGLTRRFGEIVAVDSLDLEVPTGQVAAFLGPNGAGKTTALRMLLGLIQPHAGHVELFGQALAANPVALLSRVGALVEMPSLYGHLNGRENLEVTRRMLGSSASRIERVLQIVNLEDAAHRQVDEYSLGMRQRLGLALALLGEPDLLILDEPTNGLDPAGIQEMRELLRRLAREDGVSVFLSSHLLSEVEQLASQVTILDRGRCLFQGPLTALGAERRNRILVGVDRPVEAAALLSAEGWCAELAGETLRVAGSGREARGRICRSLIEAGFGVHDLGEEISSLETAFLELTEGSESPVQDPTGRRS